MATLDFPPNLANPTEPSSGDQYTGPNGIVYVYDGSKWTSLGATIVTSESAAVGATAPSSPLNGQLWYDTTVERLKIFIGGSWKDVRPSS